MTVLALSTGHEIGLGLFGLAVVLFALVSSMWLPRRNPDFPGRHLTGFLLLSVCAFAAMLFAVSFFGRESRASGENGAAQTTAATTTTTTTTTTAPASSAELAAGRTVFTDKCAGCHTLRAAGASGTVGPNLDSLKPSEARVKRQVENGGAVMPSFSGALSSEQIAAVAAYVSSVAGAS